jgi:stage V sporulation protein AA
MNQTIYINVNQSSMVEQRQVYLKDVAEIFCQDKTIKSQVEHILLTEMQSEQTYKQVYSTCYVIDKILQCYPEYQIENLGETEFIVFYQPKASQKKGKKKEVLKIIFVSVLSFLGAAFSIMTFNTDVATPELFDRIYLIFMGTEPKGAGILQVAYSIGLFIGIVLFFNHGGRYRLTNDPSPLQVQMRQYEQSVNETFILDAERNQDSITES